MHGKCGRDVQAAFVKRWCFDADGGLTKNLEREVKFNVVLHQFVGPWWVQFSCDVSHPQYFTQRLLSNQRQVSPLEQALCCSAFSAKVYGTSSEITVVTQGVSK